MCSKVSAFASRIQSLLKARYSRKVLTLCAKGYLFFTVVPFPILPLRIKFTPYLVLKILEKLSNSSRTLVAKIARDTVSRQLVEPHFVDVQVGNSGYPAVEQISR